MSGTTSGDRAPSSFLWGAATSAYQIEGSIGADGKGPSIWDAFTRRPGVIERGETGDIASDHYRLRDADLAIMTQLGLRAYRCSISWPRVLPAGRGTLNTVGLDFYEKLIDGLLERAIVPCVTLSHWDLPLALQERGGWTQRDTARYFADYVDRVTQRLGDRVRYWVTFNEPAAFAYSGYVQGRRAPGLQQPQHYFTIIHHQLLGHALALEPLRANVRDAQIGIAHSLCALTPARAQDEEVTELADSYLHRAALDPVLLGTYPAAIAAVLPPDLVQSGDLDRIGQPTDFIGINYTSRFTVRASNTAALGFTLAPAKSSRPTASGWEVYPHGLDEWLRRLALDHPKQSILITANGAAYADEIGPEGIIDDRQRIDFLRAHVEVVLQALGRGIPITGYFVRSLLDGFEWEHGYRPTFGLVGVQRRTQQRTIKESGHWYARLIATGRPDET